MTSSIYFFSRQHFFKNNHKKAWFARLFFIYLGIIKQLKVMEKFTQNEWDHLHDVILSATYSNTKLKLDQTGLEKLFNELPENIKEDAYHWGLNDSVVRDSIYEWYQQNKID